MAARFEAYGAAADAGATDDAAGYRDVHLAVGVCSDPGAVQLFGPPPPQAPRPTNPNPNPNPNPYHNPSPTLALNPSP